MEPDCDCVEWVQFWWTEGEDGRPVLNVNDDFAPRVCGVRQSSDRQSADPLGIDFRVVATAAVRGAR